MPPGSILLHVSSDGSGEGFSVLCGDILHYRDVIQVCPVGILFPSLSSKIHQVPRAKVTQLNRWSRGGSTERGECSALRSRLAPSLLESLSEMRPAPPLGLTLRVWSWSLFGLGRGSLTCGEEPSTMAYGEEDTGHSCLIGVSILGSGAIGQRPTEGYPAPRRGGQLTPLI